MRTFAMALAIIALAFVFEAGCVRPRQVAREGLRAERWTEARWRVDAERPGQRGAHATFNGEGSGAK